MPGVTERLPVFPLAGALLFPRLHLPLHIFEPRYRELVASAMATDRRIAMIQPRDESPCPALFGIGCVGRIAEIAKTEDGRYNIVLEGESRFRLISEAAVTTPFRQIEAACGVFDDDDDEALPHILRAEFEREARRFAESRGFIVDWESLSNLDDEALINGASQIVPFDVPSKQALLEAPTLTERADLLVQLLRFFREQGETPEGVTLQ